MICVVTVTYGDRVHLLEQVVTRVLDLPGTEQISKVVIVDNGSSPKTQTYLSRLAQCEPRVRVVYSEQNLGSAGGYETGLKAALQSDARYCWLLDDDNRPEPSALTVLLDATGQKPDAAFVSLRTDREQLVRYAQGGSLEDAFGKPYSFLGFSWRSLPKKLSKRLERENLNPLSHRPDRWLQVPYAPYGGLFVATEDIEKIGFPRTDFYLYADDNEYTFRLSSSGVSLYLVPESKLVDIDKSWHVDTTEKISFVSPYLLLQLDPERLRRMYYTVRNQSYFEFRNRYSGSLEHALNALLYSLLLLVLAVFASVIRLNPAPLTSYWTYLKALNAGLHGRLGRVS